ncbi:restriction endonuclease subunit S [Vibrio coralliilyticus]|uniref:restriction endonuclease subunit S n=1 Tax=Vibrio coralliilyticus TaxID=190893 RepID=UPI00148D0477|nr:restriction endonuclease subunit S [Vibrio coralliilyticus]NOI31048.1 restriction endonuclease subunit S [Vibrio coralliilyticus]NOI50268.1 restriction endonuclease subunit S [Vibrio coralliilyticus]
MSEVCFPIEWATTNLGSIIELKYGKSLPAKTRDGGIYPVYGSNGVVGGHSTALVNTAGIVVGRKGSFGEVQLSEVAFYPIDTTYYVDEFFEQPLKYWFYQLKRLPLTQLNRSTAIPGLNREDAYEQEVRLPPLTEQKVIADKLDALLAQVATTKERLEHTLETLKQFRQSVLADAVSGKLTEKWRERSLESSNSDLDMEESFNQDRPKKAEATASHEIVTDSFPKEWGVSTFSKLYKFIDYRGKTPKKSDSGKRLYTAKNIKMGFVSNEPVEYLSANDFNTWMTRGFSKLGDIFFVTEGHTMGCTAINTIGEDIALAQRTLTLQPYGKLSTKFHYFYMLTGSFQKLVELNATGSAARGIKAAKFRSLPVPFPAYSEQKEIVHRVESLFASADVTEQQVSQALERVNNLTQSILTKAFRGELTEQWRKDNSELVSGENSAEALLEKIKSERALAKPKRKTRKKVG